MPARNPLTTQVTRILRTIGPNLDLKWHTMHEPFNILPTATASDGTTAVVGNHATWLCQAANANVLTRAFAVVLGGRAGITMTSNATAADDSARLRPIANSRYSAILPTATNTVEVEGTIVMPATITTMAVYWGLRTALGVVKAGEIATTGWTADSDQAMFVYDTTSAGTGASTANWNSFGSVATVDTITNHGSTYVVAASTSYRFKISIGTDLKPKYYINGVLVLSGATAFAGTETLIFVCGVANRATAARAVTVRDVRISLYSTT